MFSGLWLLLTDAVPVSWTIGVIAVPIATYLSLSLFAVPNGDASPRLQLSFSGLLLFIPYFTLQSLRGGWDTAWRVLHPQLPVDPGVRYYALRYLPHGPARAFFMNVVSLLPGSLSVEETNDGQLLIHILSAGNFKRGELRLCERRVAALFALPDTAAGQ